MYSKKNLILIFSILAGSMLISCQKEINGLINAGGTGIPPVMKPKVGTVWKYYYNTFYSYGSLISSKEVTYRAKSADSLGGESWLNIVDVDTDTTVYYLNTKTDGLYQFANNTSNLFCKYPATLNEAYTTFNSGSVEDFTVRGINDTIPTGIGNIPLNYYEGVKNSYLIDMIWYNDNAWIVNRVVYRKRLPPSTIYYRYSTLYIISITY